MMGLWRLIKAYLRLQVKGRLWRGYRDFWRRIIHLLGVREEEGQVGVPGVRLVQVVSLA
jgi:hypothetical protein